MVMRIRASKRGMRLTGWLAVLLSAVVGAVASPAASSSSRHSTASPPHILFVLVDDLGFADVGFNRDVPTPEVATPTLDAIVAEGVLLQRHYVHKFCTPTRTSVQSGRIPAHVSMTLANPEDPSCGIPRNMTGIAAMLKQANYKTHQVGKWDAGMATPHHTPQGRGYDTSLGYFEHKNDFYTSLAMQTKCSGTYDLWDTDHPAYDLAAEGTYEEWLFRDRLLSVIKDHDPVDPLLLFYTPHVVHCPLQVPPDYLAHFAALTNGTDETICSTQTAYVNPDGSAFACRAQYAAMVAVLDDNVKAITDALKSKGMWNNTLMIFSSDNGGPIDIEENAANNYPLRGGKYSEFEGGVRAAAFVGGGFVPPAARGTVSDGMIAIADWYGTLAALAGVDPTDHAAAASGLPPIDSVDVWPLVIGANKTSPRHELLVDANCLIQGDMKLIRGKVGPAGWAGVAYPNASTATHSIDTTIDCGDSGCLFNVSADPGEHNDLSEAMPSVVSALGSRLDELKEGIWQNNERGTDACPPGISGPCACWMATHVYKGFLGPYQEVPLTPPPGPMPPPGPSPSPALPPGGIPCSDATRPAAPFAGQDVQLDQVDDTRAAKQQWVFNSSTGHLFLESNSSLCLVVRGTNAAGNPNIALGSCADARAKSRWAFQTDASSQSALKGHGASSFRIVNAEFAGDCLDIQRGEYEIELFACTSSSTNQQYVFDQSAETSRLTVAGGAHEGMAVAVC